MNLRARFSSPESSTRTESSRGTSRDTWLGAIAQQDLDKWSGFADYSVMSDHTEVADSALVLDDRQMKLLLHRTRKQIIDLLTESPATTSQLAEALESPKGTIGHHCQQLLDAGLIAVVRTRKVRAIDEKYYGRTAPVFVWPTQDAAPAGASFLNDAITELNEAVVQGNDAGAHLATARYARIPESAAADWAQRLSDLADEFAAQPRSGETTFGVLLGLFPTGRRPLPTDLPDDSDET